MNNIEKAEGAYIEYKVKGWLDLRDKYKKNVNQNIGDKTTIEQAFIDQFEISADEFESIKKKHANIQELRNKFNNKKNQYYSEDKKTNQFDFKNFEEFYDWYKEQTKDGEICCYCGINQEDAIKSEIYHRSGRYEQRGKSIEIERVDTSEDKNIYSAKNCRLACHVCNNAKSDFLNVKEFKPIAEGINKMWSEKLGKNIEMPTEVYKTFPLASVE